MNINRKIHTESVVLAAEFISELYVSSGYVPRDMASEVGEVAQAVIPCLRKTDSLPARLLLIMRCMYLLGAQRACELYDEPCEEDIDALLQPFIYRKWSKDVYSMAGEMQSANSEYIRSIFKPFGFTFTEKGEITNV